MNFSEQVKKVKSEKGITTEQISRDSGIPFSTLNKILSNDSANPKLDVALGIAEALQCPLSYLIDGSGDHLTESLTARERELLLTFRRLDAHGKELIEMVAEKETERTVPPARAKLLSVPEERMRRLPLFDLPVSAGFGTELDYTQAEQMELKWTKTTARADFALRISGNSMEPRFSNGDLLLVEEAREVEIGELGIFVCDGEGYFKRFGGDHLHSLNPEYADIPLSRFSDIRCFGRVIGRVPV